jgi:hypothetical protein
MGHHFVKQSAELLLARTLSALGRKTLLRVIVPGVLGFMLDTFA